MSASHWALFIGCVCCLTGCAKDWNLRGDGSTGQERKMSDWINQMRPQDKDIKSRAWSTRGQEIERNFGAR